MNLHAGRIADERMLSRPVGAPAAVKAMLRDGGELALIDLREELTFSQNHLLWARNVPLSRLELRFARLVPRKTTRIVLSDDNDGLAQRAAAILARAGYSDLSFLDGGIAAWEKPASYLSPACTCRARPSANSSSTTAARPASAPQELDALMRNGTKMVVLDSRPFDEYSRVSIPTGINVPGAELVLRVHDIAPSPDTTDRGQLRRPHPQHHRRAVADQCRRAQQGGGAAQRHHGLASRRA